MTANHAHTRALEENIKAYRATIQEFWHLKSQGMADTEEIGRGFDNFIAHVRAAAEQRGAIKALRDAANDLEYLAAQIDPTLEGAEMYAKAGQEIIQTLRDRAENYHLQHGAADRIADKEGGGNA